MSGGLTSYPRTGGGGGPELRRFLQALTVVRAGGSPVEQAARDLIEALRGMGRAGLSHEAAMAFAIDARNALFVAWDRGTMVMPNYHEAMQVCAEHWKALHAIETTALAQMLTEAMAAAAMRQSVKALRDASERLGTIGLLYEISACLGRDLIKDYGGIRAPVAGHKNYMAAVDQAGTLRLLECGASYNPNIYVREDIPGAREPLIIAGEGKGGGSRYGTAGVRTEWRNKFGASRVSQNSAEYAPSRGHYMSDSATNPARREAGLTICRAFKNTRLISLSVRGTIVGGEFNPILEGWWWRRSETTV